MKNWKIAPLVVLPIALACSVIHLQRETRRLRKDLKFYATRCNALEEAEVGRVAIESEAFERIRQLIHHAGAHHPNFCWTPRGRQFMALAQVLRPSWWGELTEEEHQVVQSILGKPVTRANLLTETLAFFEAHVNPYVPWEPAQSSGS